MPVQPDDSPCKVKIPAENSDSDAEDPHINNFQTFDPFGEHKSFDPFGENNKTFDPFGHGAGTEPSTAADGPPPGIPAPAPAWPGHPMTNVPGFMPGFMPMYYPGLGAHPGTHVPPNVGGGGAGDGAGNSREEVDALLLEKAALEAENAALRAHMALEAERAGAMAAVGMHAAGLAAMQAQAQVAHAPTKKNKKKAFEAAANAGAKSGEDKKAVKDDKAEEKPVVEVVPDETFHTLMLRSLPSAHGFGRDVLMGLLDKQGFKTKYDFVYTPIDFHTERLMGFAFVNFIDHAEALKAKQALDGFCDWGVQSKKVCEVRWGDAGMQGLNANIEHYRSSPVMHESVPEQYRPVLLADGVVQVFPAPTKKIRAPRLRHSGARK